MLTRNIIIPLLITLDLFVPGLAIAQDNNEPPAQLVEVDSVNAEMITARIWVPGTVLSVTDSELSSEVSGRITWMANVGERIQAGQPVVKLDSQRLEITRNQDQANIEKWQARVNLLSARVDRFDSMAAKQNMSEDQMDEIRAELTIARQELVQARANLELTEYQIVQSQVTAPFDILVVERLQSPGEFTSVGQVLLRVVDPTKVEASVRAPLSVIPFINKGMAVPVSDSRLQVTQTVRSIVPVGNARSRMMEIRITLDPNDFIIGGAVRVGLPNSAAHEGHTVPRDALVLRKSGTYIYQVDANNKAQQIPVTTGAGLGERIEVKGKLLADGPVVIRGAERLKDGDKVRMSSATETSEELVAAAL
ncbi:efflux RND transporter periplasmic adaptor subunit [Alteromonas sediminis]|uniref:Efflux RND transporter periplasmic adaptor subunit n=1 Tax=Alteromonas sediminis TaxID=2259342 RepID=A0A3N5Y2E8_9ALTE|nr:efflux RND transporter periplasmic adaptor subunit [Alteromonas sediminis]RPJ67862.1 efflux RND transporter periplasmic adaptor subunit [Alteromonas sediminis]